MLINKRPLTFKNLVGNDKFNTDTLNPLTPELIIKGYDVPCFGIIPQSFHDLDVWEDGDSFLANDSREVVENYQKLELICMNCTEMNLLAPFLFNLQIDLDVTLKQIMLSYL